jgi:hypothetical protein
VDITSVSSKLVFESEAKSLFTGEDVVVGGGGEFIEDKGSDDPQLVTIVSAITMIKI